MKIFRFNLPGDRRVQVAAENAEDALKLLCKLDYFDGVDDSDSMDWHALKDDAIVTVWMDSDPDADDLDMPGAMWDATKRQLSAPASSWCIGLPEAEVISDSES